MTPATARELAARLRVTFYDNAIEELEREAQASLAAHPADPVALAYLSRALFKEGRFVEARQTLRQLGTHDLEGLLAHGDYHDYVGNMAEAREAYERVLAIEPDHLDGLLGLAAVHVVAEEASTADRLAAHAAMLVAPDDTAQNGRLRVVQGAIAGLKASRGGLFDKLRWGPGVRHAFEQARRLCPRSPYPAYALGRFYREAPGALGGGWANAIAHFRDAVALDPYYFPARVALIDALTQAGQDKEAEALRADFTKRFAGISGALRALDS